MSESLADLVKRLRGMDHSGGEWQEGLAGNSHPKIVAFDGDNIVGIASGMSDRNRAFVIEVVKNLPTLLDRAEASIALRAENERLKTYLAKMASDRPEDFKGRGCSDGNCVIYKPEGMHTNGGCQCATKYDSRGWGHTKLAWFKQQALAALEPKK